VLKWAGESLAVTATLLEIEGFDDPVFSIPEFINKTSVFYEPTP